jgi:hypothetical protein
MDHFGSAENFFFNYENIYDLTQGFFQRMGWNELKDPYLHHLADFIYDFEQTKGPDLSGLLDLYEEKKKSLAIQTPPSDDAIIVMTIHKSKGLEFPIVIIPDCDFDTSVKARAKYLVESDEYILHTTLSSKTKIDAIKKMHSQESEQILTDKMNLCYVGFTRPEFRLYGFNFYEKNNFGVILHQGLSSLEHEKDEHGNLLIEIGTQNPKHSESDKSTEFFEPLNISDRLWFPDIAFSKKKDLLDPSGLSEEQRFGNQFHLLMAEINSIDELDSILDSMVLQGTIDLNFKDELKTKVQSVFKDPEYNSLFSGAIDYMNEQSIIVDVENSRRPDKVILKKESTIVLDYKTGIQKPVDIKQMQEYIYLFKQMGFPEIKGYLYYTGRNELIAVN